MAKLLNIVAITDNPQSSYALSQVHKQYNDLGLFVCQSVGDFMLHAGRMSDAAIVELPFAERTFDVHMNFSVRSEAMFVTQDPSLSPQLMGGSTTDGYGKPMVHRFKEIPWSAVMTYAILLARMPDLPEAVRPKVGRLLCTQHGESLQEKIDGIVNGPFVEEHYKHGGAWLWEQDALEDTPDTSSPRYEHLARRNKVLYSQAYLFIERTVREYRR